VLQGEEKIAAVVVTYNRKDLLGQCLDSLLRQSHPLDALYVIDNHSTDGTYDFLLGRNLIAPIEGRDGEPVETIKALPKDGTGKLVCPWPFGSPDPGEAAPSKGSHTRNTACGDPYEFGGATLSLAVHYVRMPENTGGAGGFHEGMKRAAEAGRDPKRDPSRLGTRFDWLWLMDDDLLTAPDALEVLVRKKNALQSRREEPFLLNSLVLARDRPDGDTLAFPLQELTARGYPRMRTYHWRLSEVRDQITDGLYRWACPFNGTFVPVSALAEVGLPDRDFYIRGDEKDFLWRAAKRLALYTVIDSKVFHPASGAGAFDWKEYYSIRNTIVVNRHFNFTAIRNLKLILLSLARGLRHGPSGLLLVLGAIRDGLAGRLGRRDDLHP
jgi:GT2 family glycosyltransferase